MQPPPATTMGCSGRGQATSGKKSTNSKLGETWKQVENDQRRVVGGGDGRWLGGGTSRKPGAC
jgi:hypothetical protein